MNFKKDQEIQLKETNKEGNNTFAVFCQLYVELKWASIGLKLKV
jgi:hypothetical protein